MSKHYFTSIALKPIGFLTLFILLSGGIFAKTHDPPKKSARTGSVLAAVSYSVQVDPFPALTSATRRIFFDADNDGDIDMLYQTGTTATNDIFLKLNNGSGGFATTHSATNGTGTFTSGPLNTISFSLIPNSAASSGLYTLDYDNDGDTDLYEVSSSADRIIKNVGGSFSVQTSPFPLLTSFSRRVFFDADSDGDIDMLYQTGTTATNDIFLKLNNGSGGFATTHSATNGTGTFTSGPLNTISFSLIPNSAASSGLYTLDYDNDGDTDLYEVSSSADRIIKNVGGSFSVQTSPFPLLTSFSRRVFFDADSDGDIDMLYQTGTTATNDIFLKLNNGSGGFATTHSATNGTGTFTSGPLNTISFSLIPNSAASSGLYTLDYDNDGDTDLYEGVGGAAGRIIRQDVPVTPPTVTSLSPASGPAGTVVTINGTNLTGTTAVVLRGIPVNITPISSTQVSFVVPAQASTGPVRLTTPGGTVLSGTNFTVTRASSSLTYTLRSNSFNSINVSSFSTPAITDLDHDGLIDLLVGREVDGLVSHYEQSAPNSLSFTLRSTNLSGLTGHYNSIVSVTDIDGDGLLDLVVGSGAGNFKHYEQSAVNSTSFTQISNDFNNIFSTGGLTFQIPHFTDIDGDGLLDLLVGDEFLSRYEQATANGVTFNQLNNQNFGPTADAGNGGSAACVVDLDGDGRLDMLIGRSNGQLFHYEQTSANGTAFTQISTAFSGLNLSGYTTPAITDLDGDGLLDLLIGGSDGVIRHYEQANPPVITSNPVSRTVCAGSSTTFTVAATGASSFQWQVNTGSGFTDLSNTATYSGVTSTTLTISNTAGVNGFQYRCVVTGDGISVNSNPATLTGSALPIAGLSNNGPLTCSLTSVTLTASGGSSYTFTSPGGAVLGTSGATTTRVVSSPGTYSVTVANANGCVSSTSTSVMSNTSVVTVSNPSTTTATVNNPFSQSFTASNGQTPYSYSLASGTLPTGLTLATTGVLSGTPTQSGSFPITVRATDANGCFDDGPTYTLVVSPATPTIAGFAAVDNTVCVGGPITFTATIGNVSPPYAFTLSNGASTTAGNTSSTAFSRNLTASGSGLQTFTLTVNDGGSSASATTGVTVNALPTAGLTNNGPLTCDQTSVTLTASGGNSYTFTSPGGSVLGTSGATTTRVVSSPGTYSVTVANASGCVSSTSTTVNSTTAGPIATLSASPSTTLTCAQTSLTLTAGGGNAYTFSGPGIVSQSGNTAVVNAAGVYSVTVTNTATGCFSTTSITISQNASTPVATLSAAPSTTLTCAQTSLTLTAGGGNSYAFSGPGVVSQSGNTAVVNAAGVYSVTVTNTATGCVSTTSITINSNASLPTATLSASPSTTLTCSQTSLTLTAGGGNAYAFSGPGVVSQSGNTAVVNAAGVYSVTVTNTATGCSATASATVSSNTSAPSASLTASSLSFCAGSIVTLQAGAISGATYTFNGPGLTQSGASNTATASQAGSYSVVVSGSNGCTASAGVSLSVNPLPSAPTLTTVSRTVTASNTPLPLGQFVTATGSNTLSFSGVNGMLNPPNADISEAGVQSFSVSQTDGNACVSSSTPFSVTVQPAVVQPPGSQTVCRSSEVVLSTGLPGSRYEWYKNGQSAPFKLTEIASIQKGTATSSLTVVSVQTTASYYCKIFQSNGSFAFVGPFSVVVNYGCIAPGARLAASEESPAQLVVQLVPNPVLNGQVRAIVTGVAGMYLKARLTDLNGQVIRSQDWPNAEASQRIDWDISGKPISTYLLQVQAGNQVRVVKMVKGD